MKKWLWIFLITLSLKAQNSRLFIQHSTVNPSGACTGTSLWINDTGGRVYACINHAWVQLGTSGGFVTSVTGTPPIQSSGGNTPAISCIVATGSVAGCLAAADFATFNAKQPPLSTTVGLTHQFVTGFTAPNTFTL